MSPIEELIAPFKLLLERSLLEVRATDLSMQALDATHRIRTGLGLFKELLPKNAAYELLDGQIDRMLDWLKKFPEHKPEDAGEILRVFAARNLVFHWSQIEALVDDSILKMISIDKDIISKLQKANIKIPDKQRYTQSNWAKKVVEKIRSTPEFDQVRYSAIRKHAFLFETLGAKFVLDPGYWNSLDEIDYLRNVLLHKNGIVDDIAKTKAPRLEKYIGTVVPVIDPIFHVASTLINEYAFRLLMTLMTLSYVYGANQDDYLKKVVSEIEQKREALKLTRVDNPAR
jgi:hypothetical protein